MADRQSLSRAKALQRFDRDGESVERRNLVQHQEVAIAPPPSASQTAPGAQGFEAAQKGKIRGRMGAPDRRDSHLLLSSRRPNDRRLRPFLEAQGQEHAVGGARANRALY